MCVQSSERSDRRTHPIGSDRSEEASVKVDHRFTSKHASATYDFRKEDNKELCGYDERDRGGLRTTRTEKARRSFQGFCESRHAWTIPAKKKIVCRQLGRHGPAAIIFPSDRHHRLKFSCHEFGEPFHRTRLGSPAAPYVLTEFLRHSKNFQSCSNHSNIRRCLQDSTLHGFLGSERLFDGCLVAHRPMPYERRSPYGNS